MTKIEKQILAAMGVIVALIALNLMYVSHRIEVAGGIKAIVIEAGKEIKNIDREIGKY